MKSGRRHELKQNELAHGVEEFWHKIEPYWQTIAGVAVVAATAFFAVTFVSANQRRARESAWTEFFTASAAGDADALQQVAQSNAAGEVAPWALQASAQTRLIEASAEVHRDRELSRKAYLASIDGFNEVLQQTSQPLLRQRALMGLGQAHESINELSKAKEFYEQVTSTWPDTAVAKRAQDRIESLTDPSTQEFYDWFYAQKPLAPQSPAAIPGQPFQPSSEPSFSVPDPPSTGGSTAPDIGDLDQFGSLVELTDETADTAESPPNDDSSESESEAAE